jgi:hypothetical protein
VNTPGGSAKEAVTGVREAEEEAALGEDASCEAALGERRWLGE